MHTPSTTFGRLLIVIAALSITACSGMSRQQQTIDADFYFERGMDRMERKDYVKAADDFQTVVDSYSGSDIVDRAQFMLGEAHYMSEEYITAAYDYERVYMDYPTSEYAEEAHYKKALCYYQLSPIATLDQENTRLAIDEFNRFLDNYPRSEFADEAQERIDQLRAKLAYKDYLNAEQYLDLHLYEGTDEAALIYYRNVINNYPRTVWADYSRLGIGKVYMEREEYEQAREIFLSLINSDVDEEVKEEARDKLEELEERQ